MDLIEHNIKNPSIVASKMDDDLFYELQQYTNSILENKDENKLYRRNELLDKTAQGVEEAFFAKDIPNRYKNYILSFCQKYFDLYDLKFKQNKNFILDPIWVNLQKKYEFRPYHAHSDISGKGLSFVTYVRIPFDKIAEDSYPNHTSLALIKRNGKIEFTLHDLSGNMTTKLIDVDKTYEGTTLMFPNSFRHCVYPFYTSDDYRISYAGNISIV